MITRFVNYRIINYSCYDSKSGGMSTDYSNIFILMFIHSKQGSRATWFSAMKESKNARDEVVYDRVWLRTWRDQNCSCQRRLNLLSLELSQSFTDFTGYFATWTHTRKGGVREFKSYRIYWMQKGTSTWRSCVNGCFNGNMWATEQREPQEIKD